MPDAGREEEVYENMYGEIEEEIEQSSPGKIERQLRTGENEAGFKAGVREYKDESKTESPFTVSIRGPRKKAVEKIHANRSRRAQSADENYNAPVTTDEERWIENKNRLDYPGVDTIPVARQRRRAETAARRTKEQGRADRIEQKGSATTIAGRFAPDVDETYGAGENVVRVQETAKAPERTLAHEIGHAVDYSVGRGFGLGTELFDLDTSVSEGPTEPLVDEAIELSTKARGDFKGQQQYRRGFDELTADVVGQAIIQPRATRRDAPQLFERLEDIAAEEDFDDLFGEEGQPLEVLDR